MSIAKKTKEMWREIHAKAQKQLASAESVFNGDPYVDAGLAFGVYTQMVEAFVRVDDFIYTNMPSGSDLLWFFKQSLKKADELAKKLRAPILRCVNEYNDIMSFVPQIDDGQKPAFYYNLAMEMLPKMKKQTIEEIKYFARKGDEERCENLEWLLDRFGELEEQLKLSAASAAMGDTMEVRLGRVPANNPFGPDLPLIAKRIEQLPLLYVLMSAYLVTKMAVGQYYFVVSYFGYNPNTLLESFALAEYIRIYAYEISKQVKIEHYGVG